jgi:hypothetical protein
MKKNWDITDKTKGRKKKATCAEPEEEVKKGEEEKAAACNRCVVGFAIRVDKSNNTKGGLDKKLVEGLSFLRISQ